MLGYKCVNSCLAITGLLLIVGGGLVLLVFMPKIVRQKVIEEVYIRNNSDAYDRWQKTPITIQWTMYFFNITNPENFNGKDIQSLNFEQVGPYVYDEIREKVEIEFDSTKNNVTYEEKKTYKFNKKLSKGHNENETISIINIVYGLPSSMLQYLDQDNPEVYQPMMTDTVENIAFGTNDLLGTSLFKSKITTDRQAIIDTGRDNIDKLGQFVSWDNERTLSVWKENGTCNELYGTDGTIFRPGLTENDIIWVYESMLCRKLFFKTGLLPNIKVKDITTLRFVIPNENFDHIEENACYCWEDNSNDCPGGLLNLAKCPVSSGVDIIASTPFFYSNPLYLEKSGLKSPLPITLDNYATILDIEPNTGTVLKAVKRLQLNIKVKKGSLQKLSNLTEPYFVAPMMWLEEAGEIDDENANMLKDKLIKPKKLFSGILISVIVIGFILMILAGGCALCKR